MWKQKPKKKVTQDKLSSCQKKKIEANSNKTGNRKSM